MRQLRLPVGACSLARFHKPRWDFKYNNFARHLSSQQSDSDDPLRILFCGTELFSIESLRALHDYSKTPESNILSIDVVTKTDKRVGRGRKQLQVPLIKPAAQELGLPVHQIDTFTGWQPPAFGDTKNEHCNLIIAVSFGLLIPPRILGTAKYGGLNVHPSMLPDLRGPAPLEWAIVHGRRTTGVTLQTLHPSRFDEGIIVDQSPPPGLDIPNPDEITAKELKMHMAPIGAKMLVDAIRNRLYIPPYNPIQLNQHGLESDLVHAPKMTRESRAVDFKALTTTQILRRKRAIGALHGFASLSLESNQTRQVNFDTDMRALEDGDIPEEVQATAESIPEGVP